MEDQNPTTELSAQDKLARDK